MHAFSSSIVQQGSKVFFLDCDHSFATRLSNLKTSCRNQPTGAPLKRRVHSSASDDDRGREVVSPMPPPPDLGGKDPRKYWNATALAFLGDSVWELYVRRKYFDPPKRLSSYYQKVVDNVRAESQAEACMHLEKSDFLSEDELSILRWGKNATGILPKRFSQGSNSREIYRSATAIECLSGYLYLTSLNRLNEVMVYVGMAETIQNPQKPTR